MNSNVIGTVASLTVEKGHIYLINAAKEIISSFPKVGFYLWVMVWKEEILRKE